MTDNISLLDQNRLKIMAAFKDNDYREALYYAKKNYDLCIATDYIPLIHFATIGLNQSCRSGK